MTDLFRDTVFGRLLHAASGGKILQYDDQVHLNTLQKSQSSKIDSESSLAVLNNALEKTNQQQQPVAEDDKTLDKTGDTLPPSTREDSREKSVDGSGHDPEKGADHMLVTWAPNDPANPRNWSKTKKFFVTFQICLLTTSVYIGSAIYTAGLEGVGAQFHISPVHALLGLTLFVIGYALGPMVWAPMSEIPYVGRNPVYVGTLFAFIILQFPVIYAPNAPTLLAFRFITGLVGSPVLATGGATVADIYEPRKQAYGIGIWGIAAVFGPAMGPLIGGFAAENKGWTWTIWELMWLSAFCFVFLFCLLPETSSSNILYRRTCRLRALTGNPNIKCEPELEAEGMSTNEILMMVFIRPFTLTFTEPICFLLNLYLALIYGLLYLWFESFPIVFLDIYHFSLGTEGLAFLGILIGCFIIAGPFFWFNYKYVEPQFNEEGRLRPEVRLQPAFLGSLLIPVCLFWFGWSARESIPWIMPIIGSAFFSMGSFLLFMAVLAYLGDSYPKYIASVFAGNDLMRSSFGAAFPLFADAMYHKLGVGWASSLLGFLSIAFIPIPFVLYYYGKKIRCASKMATHDL